MDDVPPKLIDRIDLSRLLVDAASDAIFLMDTHGVVLDCNPAAAAMFRCRREDLLGTGILDRSPERQPDGRLSSDAARDIAVKVLGGCPQRVEWLYARSDGSLLEAEVTLAPLAMDGHRLRAVIARDISARKAMERRMLLSEQKFAKLFEISPDPMVLAEIATGRIHDVNLSFTRAFGFSKAEVLGRTTVEIGLWHDPAQRDATVALMRQCGQLRNHEVDFRTKTGGVVSVLGSSAEVTVDGRSCWLVQFKDITERKAHLEAMEFLAHHDPLTGLPNRKRLHEALAARIRQAEAGGGGFVLMLLDLDRFKEVNDTLGHHVGDELLQIMAARLSLSLYGRDGFVARLGGDEFAVILPSTGAEEATAWASEFLASLRRPFALEGIRVEVGSSIGIALYPDDGRDPSTLLRCADVAMYVAKRTQSGCSRYTVKADRHCPSRLALMADLGEAIRHNQLVLHYQPIMRLGDGAIAGMEALVRWRHPTHGLIPPGEFVPMAEMSDLILGLTGWVLDAAVAQARIWQDEGRGWRVAVNLSARNLIDGTLPDQVRDVLARHGLAPERLELEITETAMLADPERAIEVIERIAALGVDLAIDDFGIGYSSFATLRRLPRVRTLKIDQSFVRRMLADPADAAVVEMMVSLTRRLGLRAIAEGVEDADTLEALRRCDCAEVQGYHIARPMEAAALAEWHLSQFSTNLA